MVTCSTKSRARIAAASAMPRAASAPSARSGSASRMRFTSAAMLWSRRAMRVGLARSPPMTSIRLPSNGAWANRSCNASSPCPNSLSPLASATNSDFGKGGGAPTQATCGVGNFVAGPPMRQALSASAKAAICTQRPSISSPCRLSRSTAVMASAGVSPSSADRSAASAASASVKKCPLPQQGSSMVISAARAGQPGKLPAAGRQTSSARTKRRYSHW